MQAFLNQASVKRTYLARVKAHAKADEIIHGTYWENGKGCAVGCTIHGNEHSRYETELGIPRILARLEDVLFERMANGHAKEFPLQFLSAIKVGADLSNVWNQYAHWMLLDPEYGVIRFAKHEKTKASIERVGKMYGLAANGENQTKQEWRADAASAYAAAAASAYADADSADVDAANSAAYAADSAAYAAAADADAVYAADAAAAADADAYAAARKKARSDYAYIAGQKLIALMKATPVCKP